MKEILAAVNLIEHFERLSSMSGPKFTVALIYTNILALTACFYYFITTFGHGLIVISLRWISRIVGLDLYMF